MSSSSSATKIFKNTVKQRDYEYLIPFAVGISVAQKRHIQTSFDKMLKDIVPISIINPHPDISSKGMSIPFIHAEDGPIIPLLSTVVFSYRS
jgi:hypothetical protein